MDIDRKVAEALGWEVQVQESHVDGVPELAAWPPGERGKSIVPFSPSTDPADALACLDAWCRKHDTFFGIDFDSHDGYGCWIDGTVDTGFGSPTLCEAACSAILKAAEAAP